MNWYLEQGSVLMPEITFSTERAGACRSGNGATALSRPTQLAVGVMPFSNRSNQSDWLGFGLEYLLTNKFSQISAYKLADREIVTKIYLDRQCNGCRKWSELVPGLYHWR